MEYAVRYNDPTEAFPLIESRVSKSLKTAARPVKLGGRAQPGLMTQGKTVMVVDDDRDILTVASRGLENAGFQVHSFNDPIAALQHVEGGCQRCEVIISDMRMPGMSGFQLVRRVKDLRPEIKIVMMTAFELNKSEFESVFPSTKVDKVMQKPFAISELAETIKDIYREDSAEKS